MDKWSKNYKKSGRTRLIRRKLMDGSGLESSYKGKDQGDMLNVVQVEIYTSDT